MYQKLWCLTHIETLSTWDWNDGSSELNIEDARSLATDKWNLDHFSQSFALPVDEVELGFPPHSLGWKMKCSGDDQPEPLTSSTGDDDLLPPSAPNIADGQVLGLASYEP